MNKQLGAVVTAWGLFAGMTGIALADLKAVDPGPYTAATGYFPHWYQDRNDLSLELCQSKALSPTGGYLCTLIPEAGVYDDTQPMVFPDNWPSELFWFLAETTIPAGTVNGYTLDVYVAGIEAAFAGGPPKENDQQAFARIRIRASVPNNRTGVYTITHPYGVETINVTQGGRRAINITKDVGIAAPGDFTGAMTGQVGPFLRSTSGNVTAINPETGETEIFIGDPNVPGPVTPIINPVTGQPVDYVEISGPAGTMRTTQFSVSGKILDSRPATPVEVERSTYSRTGTGSRISVFAKANLDSNVCYRETLEMVPGTPPSPCLINLRTDGRGYFFANNPFPQTLPRFVVVTALDPNGVTRPTAVSSPLIDVVKISTAQYFRDTRTLTIEATSSDEVVIPDLAAAGFGKLNKLGTLQRLTVTGLAQPPAQVTVKSAAGGADSEPVTVLATAPAANQPPVGVADSASTSPGTFVDIPVLANDSDPEDDLPLGVASVTQPASGQGSVAINAGGTSLRYTPPTTVATAFTANFSYVAKDSEGMLSDPVAVSVSVSASNQPPVANPDSATTTAGGPAITINVLGNDTDNNQPLSVTAVTQPPTGQGSVGINADGTLSYTPPASVASTLTAAFTYTVTDSLGASAIGNVSVTVNPPAPAPAPITVATARVRAGSNNRFTWELSGTTTVTNTTLTIDVTTTDSTTPERLGTVTPRADGRWSLTVRNTTQFPPTPNPSATITATRTGATVTVPVQRL